MTKNKVTEGYFKKQYKLVYNKDNVELYKKWIASQWNIIEKEIEFNKNINILEIGSGIGTIYGFIKDKKFNKYLGLELDNQAVQFTGNYYGKGLFENKSLEDFKSGLKFDYVLAFEVLEHLDNPEEALEKIKTLLSKNGKFIGTSPYPFRKNVLADPSHKYVLHPINWIKLFNEKGFKNARYQPMSFLPFLWRINANLNPVIPVYLPFPYFISTTLLIAEK